MTSVENRTREEFLRYRGRGEVKSILLTRSYRSHTGKPTEGIVGASWRRIHWFGIVSFEVRKDLGFTGKRKEGRMTSRRKREDLGFEDLKKKEATPSLGGLCQENT